MIQKDFKQTTFRIPTKEEYLNDFRPKVMHIYNSGINWRDQFIRLIDSCHEGFSLDSVQVSGGYFPDFIKGRLGEYHDFFGKRYIHSLKV